GDRDHPQPPPGSATACPTGSPKEINHR
ncbi:hypothetical protein A2U01_0065517, partial [Trifolium medium]|nr:hypothetical protein [Trifolium medium]